MQQTAPGCGAKLARLVHASTRGNKQKCSSSREDADDFEQLRADLIKEHNQQSVLESELVERLAVILWRLRRVPCFEAAILDARHQQVWNQKNYCLPEPEGQEKEKEASDEEESDWETSVDLALALMDGLYGKDRASQDNVDE